MEEWIRILLPFVLVTTRTSTFLMTLPLFGWRSLPARVRVGMALTLSVFFATVLPVPEAVAGARHWLDAGILVVQEVLCGLGLGLAAGLLFRTVQQSGLIASRQMGFADAGIINPQSSDRGMPLSMVMEMAFALFFLSAGGHLLLLKIVAHSYEAFPVGRPPDAAYLARGVVEAGSAMMTFSLQLAAPLLAAFLVLGVVLGILARVLPEMNVLMASFPLRVGLGMLMAAGIFPVLRSFSQELALWMNRMFAM